MSFVTFRRYSTTCVSYRLIELRFYARSQNCEKRLLASSCPLEQLRLHWTDFYEIWYLNIVLKSVAKIQVLLKYDNNNGCFTWRPMYVYGNISLNSSKNDTCFRQSCRENQNTHFVFNIFFFRKSCHLWDNVEKYVRARQATDDNIIRRMRFACWITKTTDRHSEHVILIGFPRKQWLR
jgi:hypothetical protein